MKSRIIKLQTLTKEAFAPYGHVLMLNPGKPLIRTQPPLFTDRVPFEVDEGNAEFVYSLLERREFKFCNMERHLKVTQGFFPLHGGAAIITVAPATNPNDPESLPSPDSVKAFLLESYNAVVINRGIWHGMIFPLEEKFGYILATRDKTTEESLAPLYDGDVQIRELETTFEIML